MKKLTLTLLVVFAVFPLNSIAQSDYSVTWDLSGLEGVSQVTVDMNVGTVFLTANGGILLENGLTIAVTGTCFFTAQGGVLCTFVLPGGSTAQLDVGANLSGVWKEFDVNNFLLDSGPAVFVSVQ